MTDLQKRVVELSRLGWQTERERAELHALVAQMTEDEYFALGCGCEHCLSHFDKEDAK